MDGRKPRDTAPNARPARPAATSPPDEAWLFAQDVLGKSVSPPDEVWSFAQAVLGKPVPVLDEPFTESTAEHDLRQWSSEIATLHEGSWDPVKHPHGGFSLNRGWFSLTGGAGGATTPRLGCTPWSLQATVPMTTPWNPALPSGRGHAGAAVGPAARVAAGGLLGGLNNASMGAYWSRVPGAQAMPAIWQHELDKRVRAGTLSRKDATGIFNTALLGAQAQRFAPTGGTMSAVHQSAVDFLAKAEGHYRGLRDAKKAGAFPYLSSPCDKVRIEHGIACNSGCEKQIGGNTKINTETIQSSCSMTMDHGMLARQNPNPNIEQAKALPSILNNDMFDGKWLIGNDYKLRYRETAVA
jgi:hypothetical protein